MLKGMIKLHGYVLGELNGRRERIERNAARAHLKKHMLRTTARSVVHTQLVDECLTKANSKQVPTDTDQTQSLNIVNASTFVPSSPARAQSVESRVFWSHSTSFMAESTAYTSADHFKSSPVTIEDTRGRDSSMSWCLAPMFYSLSTAFSDLGANCIFMSALWSWFIAQIVKLFTSAYREGTWDHRVMFDSGGMPSSHTSLVVGLTTSITYQYGLGSVYFPLSLAFTLIVMYDAAGVRRHAGKQAEVLNKIVEDLFHGSPISDRKLKEVLGHSPLQVLCGAILGVAVGILYMLKYSN